MKPAGKPMKPAPRSGGARGRGATVVKNPGERAQVFKSKVGKPLSTSSKRK